MHFRARRGGAPVSTTNSKLSFALSPTGSRTNAASCELRDMKSLLMAANGVWFLNESVSGAAQPVPERIVNRAATPPPLSGHASVCSVSKNVRFLLPISRRPTTRFKLSERLHRPARGSIVVWKSNKHS